MIQFSKKKMDTEIESSRNTSIHLRYTHTYRYYWENYSKPYILFSYVSITNTLHSHIHTYYDASFNTKFVWKASALCWHRDSWLNDKNTRQKKVYCAGNSSQFDKATSKGEPSDVLTLDKQQNGRKQPPGLKVTL